MTSFSSFTLRFFSILLVTVAPLASLGSLSGCKRSGTSAQKRIHVAAWSNYLTADFIGRFEQETGIKIDLSIYSSNEELLAKLQAGASGYDVAMPSDYMVSVMVKLGLLEKLDHTKVGLLPELDRRFVNLSFDPGNKYSMPFDWGATGIAINRNLYKGKLTSWKDLFENEDLKGKFTLLDDSREAIAAALKSFGYSLNSTDPVALAKARDRLMKARERVKAFSSETLTPLTEGEVAVAHSYLGDALLAKRKSGHPIEFIVPEEGAVLWIDNLVIPKGAKHREEAHLFIKHLLDPKSQALTVQSVMISPSHPKAIDFLPVEYRQNHSLFPKPAVMKRLERLEDLGDAVKEWDRIWTEVKAGSA